MKRILIIDKKYLCIVMEDIIPKIIHKIIITDDNKTPLFPELMLKAVYSFKIMNPNYELRLYNGDDCINYITTYFSKRELYAFNTLIPYAYKCDLMKYLILFNEGGYYSDMKSVCLKSFDDIFPEDIVWFSAIDRDFKDRISNGFLISTKGNIVLKETINSIIDNCIHKRVGETSLFPTGGALLSDNFVKHNTIQKGMYIGKHKKESDNKFYFFDHNNNIFLKTKYTQENGTEFSSGSWDKFDYIQGNNYNILWKNHNVYKHECGFNLWTDRVALFAFIVSVLLFAKSIRRKVLPIMGW